MSKKMTPRQQIQALEGLGITRYRISIDTKINEKTLSNWALGVTKPFKSNANVAVLDKYYKSSVSKIHYIKKKSNKIKNMQNKC